MWEFDLEWRETHFWLIKAFHDLVSRFLGIGATSWNCSILWVCRMIEQSRQKAKKGRGNGDCMCLRELVRCCKRHSYIFIHYHSLNAVRQTRRAYTWCKSTNIYVTKESLYTEFGMTTYSVSSYYILKSLQNFLVWHIFI